MNEKPSDIYDLSDELRMNEEKEDAWRRKAHQESLAEVTIKRPLTRKERRALKAKQRKK